MISENTSTSGLEKASHQTYNVGLNNTRDTIQITEAAKEAFANGKSLMEIIGVVVQMYEKAKGENIGTSGLEKVSHQIYNVGLAITHDEKQITEAAKEAFSNGKSFMEIIGAVVQTYEKAKDTVRVLCFSLTLAQFSESELEAKNRRLAKGKSLLKALLSSQRSLKEASDGFECLRTDMEEYENQLEAVSESRVSFPIT